MKRSIILLSGAVLLLSGSAFALGKDPSPVLYPNKYLTQVGQAKANQDIAECNGKAAAYVQSSRKSGDGLKSGARGAVKGAALGTVGGAIMGNTGRGAGAGAAVGATNSALKGIKERGASDPTFQQFSTACLEDKGYKVLEWK